MELNKSCPLCKFKYTLDEKLKKHIKLKHENETWETINEQLININCEELISETEWETNFNPYYVCFLCEFKEKNKFLLVQHLNSIHLNLKWSEIENIVLQNKLQETITSKSWERNQKRREESKKKKKEKKKNTIVPPSYKNEINLYQSNVETKCLLIKSEIDQIKKSLFKEQRYDQFIRLGDYIKELINNLPTIENIPKKINKELNEYEFTRLTSLDISLTEVFEKIKLKNDFIKDDCKTIYITWDDITFERNKIKISPNKIMAPAQEIPGSMIIFNEIKINYFVRKYKSEKYKLIFYKGFIVDELSPHFQKIVDIITDHVNEITEQKQIEKIHNQFIKGELTKSQAKGILDRLIIKNQFISIPAKLTNDESKVIGILENNNDMLEESLLFVFKTEIATFVLWENIIPNRASYMFELKDDVNIKLKKIQNFIERKISYKRWDLFTGTNLISKYKIKARYYQFNHTTVYEYEQKIKSILYTNNYKFPN